MRIAVVQETYIPFVGGSSYRAHEVFKRLVESGHEVDVYTARISRDLKVDEQIDGINVHRIETPKGLLTEGGEFRVISDVIRFTVGVFWRLLATRKHYDVYEVNHCPLFPVFAVEMVSRLRQVPASITFHEVWKELWFSYIKSKPFCHLGMLLERMTTRMGKRVIAVSSVTAERLASCYGVSEKRVKVISNGIDLRQYDRASSPKVPYRIVYLGRLNKHKNVDILIGAYQRVKQLIPDATLEIAGDGPERANLEAQSQGIPGITFHGIVSEAEKARLLCSAWLYVLPSVREGQGITLLEAMAAGTPTIAAFYEGSGVLSVIRDGENGLLANPDVADTTAAILRYAESPQLYEAVREAGLRFVQSYDWVDIAYQHENLYRSMLREETSPAYSWRSLPVQPSVGNALE